MTSKGNERNEKICSLDLLGDRRIRTNNNRATTNSCRQTDLRPLNIRIGIGGFMRFVQLILCGLLLAGCGTHPTPTPEKTVTPAPIFYTPNPNVIPTMNPSLTTVRDQ